MYNNDDLKKRAFAAIDAQRDWLISAAIDVLHTPETGFREFTTSSYISEKLNRLGISHRQHLAITGIKGYLEGSNSGPTVALLGEMDAFSLPRHLYADPSTGSAHACGHHCQVGMLLGTAVGLMADQVMSHLSGRIALIATPAEEYIEMEYRQSLRRQGALGFLSGKQELIRLGELDDVDMAITVHTSSNSADRTCAVGGTSNGHLGKYVSFGPNGICCFNGAPLKAAEIALNAIHAQRETLLESDSVRFHGILHSEPSFSDVEPGDLRYECRVRGGSNKAIQDADLKLERCIHAGALAMGIPVRIATVPGYWPMINDDMLADVFMSNASRLVGESAITRYPPNINRGGSTDMGDLSNIIPAIHPYIAGAKGMPHGVGYLIDDYDLAVITASKVITGTLIDLLASGANIAKAIVQRPITRLLKSDYLAIQARRFNEITYAGE